MTFSPSHLIGTRLIGAIGCAAIACLFLAEGATAQTVQYYYPANNYGWNYAAQPTTHYYTAPRTTSYRSTPRPYGGYGANLHRNFTIRQELLRSQRTGQPVRNRGNLLWFR